MRRTGLVLLIVAAALGLSPGSALAGGATFEFERTHYAAGEVVTGTVNVWMNPDTASVDAGPFYAYLLPAEGEIHPPRIPPEAIPIGQVEFSPLADDHALASVSFTLPDVPTGRYGVHLCNRPCRTTVVGDLIGGWFTVSSSPEEARFQSTADRIAQRVAEHTGSLNESLWAAVDDLDRRENVVAERVSERFESLGDQLGALETRLAMIQARLAADDRPAPFPLAGAAGWVVAGILAIVAGLHLLGHRREGRRGDRSDGRRGDAAEAWRIPDEWSPAGAPARKFDRVRVGPRS